MPKNKNLFQYFAIGIVTMIIQCSTTPGTHDSSGDGFVRVGLIQHSIPHSEPRVSFTSLNTNCTEYNALQDATDYDVWLSTSTIHAPYGIYSCGEIGENLRDTGIVQTEMTCDSLPMLIALMKGLDYTGGTWATQLPYEKNTAFVVRCKDSSLVLLGTVGQYWGAYVRRQYFWATMDNWGEKPTSPP